jgi:hypothetical protein
LGGGQHGSPVVADVRGAKRERVAVPLQVFPQLFRYVWARARCAGVRFPYLYGRLVNSRPVDSAWPMLRAMRIFFFGLGLHAALSKCIDARHR